MREKFVEIESLMLTFIFDVKRETTGGSLFIVLEVKS